MIRCYFLGGNAIWRYFLGGDSIWRYFLGGNAIRRYFLGGNAICRYFFSGNICMYGCMVITYSRVWINRVRLPILLVVS